ncbi:MAG TPA: cytochrome ubiquinol oxidase subunit I [bacterium]|nr:cytochrome ubiquinol oxidase subunit I [bacterium]HNT66550.1 cytochrome ubiquinol oxidase subunit I [bacterium]HOX86208.1 cytochrome ubiquinol oxidase subunit I [bacterium]HPG45578.1 cytochrome ubiquinol oxidase subunit I [bacterium]HPM97643.1 cytochrome ubiquinol oxidase subunit I [bacterium]
MDNLLLSRLQFGLTIAFHYLFPPLSIGLGLILVIMEGLYLKTAKPIYLQMTRFWARIFGLVFALGVASGIVMEFQFGTNWSTYSRFVGDVFGSALAAEGIFAFFLESGFLAILLFGWDRVKPRTHFFATVMVAFGAHFSAVWIIIANSWQQTPAGHHVVAAQNGLRAEIVDFWQMVLNPSAIDRLTHSIAGAWQAGAFFVISVCAFYVLKNRHLEFARKSLKIGLWVAAIASLAQLVTGHSSAITVSRTQPPKLAAFEGHYAEFAPADMYLFGWVDQKENLVHGIKIPGFLSFLVHGNSQTPLVGLNAVPETDRPPVQIVFQSYHLMIAIGFGLIALSWLGIVLLWRGRLFHIRWLLWTLVFSVLGPQVANQVGWASAEIGRQPWIVYGLLRTSEAVSPSVSAGQILTSLILFGLIYTLLFALFVYLLNEKIQAGPLGEDMSVEGRRA